MALTDPELTFLARKLGDRIFVQPNVTAHSDRDSLKAGIQAIDNGMGATTTQVENQYPATVLKQAIFQEFRGAVPDATVQEDGIGVAIWALYEAGLL